MCIGRITSTSLFQEFLLWDIRQRHCKWKKKQRILESWNEEALLFTLLAVFGWLKKLSISAQVILCVGLTCVIQYSLNIQQDLIKLWPLKYNAIHELVFSHPVSQLVHIIFGDVRELGLSFWIQPRLSLI